MHFGGRQAYLVCVMIAGGVDSCEDVTELRFVVQQPEQRLADRTSLADAQNVLSGRVDPLDQEVVVEQDDARTQAAQDVSGQTIEAAAVAGCAATAIVARFVAGSVVGRAFGQRTGRPMIVFCCT